MQTVANTAIMAYGIIFLAAGISGYMFISIEKPAIRVLLACVAVFIIIPETITTVVGIPLGAVILVYFYMQKRKQKTTERVAA